MWHPTRNEGWVPHTISAASDVRVWWVCPVGHEWHEAVRDRTALRKWKRGNVTACGLCLGSHVLQVCRCGRQRLARAGSPSYECVTCCEVRLQALARRRQRAHAGYVVDLAAAEKLLDGIVPARLPSALAAEWRSAVRSRLLRAMEEELGYGKYGTTGAIDDALRQIQDEGDLLPTIDELRAAYAAGEPIEFMDRMFWTQGVLHLLGVGATAARRDRVAAASLEQWVRAGAERAVNRSPAGGYRTADVTRVITDLVEEWGQHDQAGPWRSHLEVAAPFIVPTGALCGRFDVVLTRTDTADVVVEIDSQHRARSMEKLRFAHAAGATAVWIRWHSGVLRNIPGVYVIDLLDLTKRMTRS